jgi:hypothetical protein
VLASLIDIHIIEISFLSQNVQFASLQASLILVNSSAQLERIELFKANIRPHAPS